MQLREQNCQNTAEIALIHTQKAASTTCSSNGASGECVTTVGQLAFLNTSLALEDTGVTAYLGQPANIDVVATLGTAFSILGVEAQHAAAKRSEVGERL